MFYFSLATLTTTGYGDIVPLYPFARSLASLESVVGPFYLAITVARLVTLSLRMLNSATQIAVDEEYEALLARSDPHYAFPEFDKDTRATTFYTTGTTGLPKGVYFSHRQLVLHTMAVRSAFAGTGHGRFNEGDVYMPITPIYEERRFRSKQGTGNKPKTA